MISVSLPATTIFLPNGDGTPAGIDGVAEYSTDLFDPATAERLTRRLVRLLTALATDPDRRIGDVDLLDDGEHSRLGEWTATAPEVKVILA